jgi:release factor glutamine methyltransferase
VSARQTIGAVMQAARGRLREVTETPGLDVQLLLMHVTGRSREELLTHPEEMIDPDDSTLMEKLVSDYEEGCALPHLLGWWEFYGHRFEVSPHVLIPRPETELLVETALTLLPSGRPAVILDVGTGSGIIPVSLLLEDPNWRALGADRYRSALEVAARNTAGFKLQDRLGLVQSHLGTAFSRGFDIVCANLPYIPTSRLSGLEVAAREPLTALDGGADGMDLIRDLILDLPRLVRAGGAALLEIESGQGEAVCRYARQNLPGTSSRILKDLAGRDRLLVINGFTGASITGQ